MSFQVASEKGELQLCWFTSQKSHYFNFDRGENIKTNPKQELEEPFVSIQYILFISASTNVTQL